MPTVASASPLHSPPVCSGVLCCCCRCCCWEMPVADTVVVAAAAALVAHSATLAEWAPSESRALPLLCCRAAGVVDARAAAMLKRVRAGLVGLPPPLVTAHSPTVELVFGRVCGS